MVIGAGCAERVSATGTIASADRIAAIMKRLAPSTGYVVTIICPAAMATKFVIT